MGGFTSSDGLAWLLIGGYYSLDSALASRRRDRTTRRALAALEQLTDRPLEEKIGEELYRNGTEKFEEIWRYIERFKRENPHIVVDHFDSYWRYVGKERFPLSMVQFARQTGKVPNKSEQKMIHTYIGWTVTLLMNTQNKYSMMEGTRHVFRAFGDNTWGWTREYG